MKCIRMSGWPKAAGGLGPGSLYITGAEKGSIPLCLFAPLRLCARILRMTKPSTTFPIVAGKKTQLTIGGEGPPLLYLHSAGGETDWMPFHEKLAQHFTVYLPAHPGFAESKGLEQIRDIYDL